MPAFPLAMIGQRIGQYEITAKLGEGGMGVVYRAADAELGRDVAIKLLPEHVRSDETLLARFEREARALAALNHPGIAQIYGLARSGNATGLVMELVEGPTLADRLAAGPLDVDEALAIADGIAAALEEAHSRGIVHRDLKPQNVKLAGDSGAAATRVKVL
ncbi:MAG: serine/threonine-protein kinase, partial [Thermoanaerobaculia bacterium]|nr:serine/threonine-protein kinase [Thermoanaerobaculia bacterium]